MARAANGIEVVGTKFVRLQLEQFLPRESKSILRRSVARIAANLRKEMRKRAPKDEGTLRRAIISKRDRGTPTRVEASVWVTHGNGARHDAWYWHFIEFGTEQQLPRPFATPVIEDARPKMPRIFEREIATQVVKQLENKAKRQRLKA